ncbi:MAG: gliding motility-associated ABC transporter permease subunit GldF [Taibaiella sp.]|nr:gliding motility-associated ABC transporter permease subunit GldF [Taibaiella sp.]
MKEIYLKELRSFFSSMIGYVVLLAFLVMSGILLWVLPDTSILEYGYASLDQFFRIAPWLLLFLIPAVTMRSFSDEYKGGTIEWLYTKPISSLQIIAGKYLAALTLVIIGILPTLIYLFSIVWLSADGAALDTGGIIGSYIGLIFLCGAFTGIGIFCSAITDSQIVSFIIALILCYILYSGFEALSRITSFAGGADYYLEMIGVDYHYRNMSRGVIGFRNVVYFLSLIFLFFLLTRAMLQRKREM